MCGRYALVGDQRELEGYFKRTYEPQYRGPNYNVSPTQSVPVLTSDGFIDMRWGLIPQWAKSLNSGFSMINARAESIMEKPLYKGIINRQRCIVPASGFYEWQETPAGKVPHYFHLVSRKVFGFAGLYVTRKDSEGHVMHSFTIITTTPNEVVSPVHDRMPVILPQPDEAVWLDATVTDPADVMACLVPYKSSDMDEYIVSNDVGSTKNNDEYLIEPAPGQG